MIKNYFLMRMIIWWSAWYAHFRASLYLLLLVLLLTFLIRSRKCWAKDSEHWILFMGVYLMIPRIIRRSILWMCVKILSLLLVILHFLSNCLKTSSNHSRIVILIFNFIIWHIFMRICQMMGKSLLKTISILIMKRCLIKVKFALHFYFC